MRRTTLFGMIVGLLLSCCGGVLFASEADELRERAKAMRKEASVMAERGNKEQAEKRGEDGVRPGIDKEVRHLKERLQDLLAKEKKMREAKAPKKELAEVREQISGTERELHTIHSHDAGQGKLPPEFRAQAEKIEATSRRIHHLRVAAQNLKMAEAHDLARELMEKAEAMERDVGEGKRRLAAEIQKAHDGEHGPDVVRELKAEIERLRAEVKELRHKIENR